MQGDNDSAKTHVHETTPMMRERVKLVHSHKVVEGFMVTIPDSHKVVEGFVVTIPEATFCCRGSTD